MRRQLFIFLLSSVLFLCLCGACPGGVDTGILLEKRYPTYWKQIVEDGGYRVLVPADYQDYRREQISEENLLLQYDWAEGNYAGVELVRTGDIFCAEGEASASVWPGLTTERLCLGKGTYFLDVGFAHPHIQVYLEGWKEGVNTVLASGLGSAIFRLEEGAFPEGCKLVLGITEGSLLEGEILMPVLVHLKDPEKEEIIPAQIWRMERAAWEGMSLSERKILLRTFNYQYRGCEWCSILFEDGSGVQYRSNILREGKINSCGVVEASE